MVLKIMLIISLSAFATDYKGVNSDISVSLGSKSDKTVVMKHGSLTTTSQAANQFISSYTVTANKTFFLEYYDAQAFFTVPSTNPARIGTLFLELPAFVTVASVSFITSSLAKDTFKLDFAEPIQVSSGTIIRSSCTPDTTTSSTWQVHYGGYEK